MLQTMACLRTSVLIRLFVWDVVVVAVVVSCAGSRTRVGEGVVARDFFEEVVGVRVGVGIAMPPARLGVLLREDDFRAISILLRIASSRVYSAQVFDVVALIQEILDVGRELV